MDTKTCEMRHFQLAAAVMFTILTLYAWNESPFSTAKTSSLIKDHFVCKCLGSISVILLPSLNKSSMMNGVVPCSLFHSRIHLAIQGYKGVVLGL